MQFTDLTEKWLEWLSLNKGRSDATIIKYRGYLLVFSDFLDKKTISEVDLELLENFSGKFLYERGLTSRSRSAAIAAIRNFFSWCTSKGLIISNPANDLAYPTIGRRLPRAISLQDAEKMLRQPDLDTFSGVRDAAMMSLLIGCGMRVSGLCGLNQSSLIFTEDHNQRERLIVRTLEKGSKERLIPAPTEALLMVRAYLGHSELDQIDRTLPNGDQVVFVSVANRKVPAHEYNGENRRFATRSVNDMLAKHAKDAGVSSDIAHPHAFRHLYGTELIESDVNLLTAQALLGHESADTTQIYTHLAVRKLIDEIHRANPLGKMRTPVSDLISHLNA